MWRLQNASRSLLPLVGFTMLCVPLFAAYAQGQQANRVLALRRDTTPPAFNRKDFEVSALETRVLGQRTWLRGGPASLRIIVGNHLTGKAAPASVSLGLAKMTNGKPDTQTVALYTGQTNGIGTLDAQFHAPKVTPGAYQLTINVKSPIGNDTVTQPIQITESMQLMLTSDKPLYQPGQTVHLRALALDMATREALAAQPITFEVEDARGNKVFKKHETLSRYGVASADFILADEVNMGAFTLRAILPTGESEKKVRVERYVLPKYKIAITTDKPYYLPGEQVKGTVKATYFFGKPVGDAQVTVAINTLDVGVTKLAEMKDKTDPIGVYTFRYTLPNSFVGQPFAQGKAQIEFAATIKDKADHKQEAHQSVPVVREPISLVVVPESRTLVPNVENRFYIAAATPDGTPLKNARLFIHTPPATIAQTKLSPQEAERARKAYAQMVGAENVRNPVSVERDRKGYALQTDDMGLATFAFRADAPSAAGAGVFQSGYTWIVEATDAQGHRATTNVVLQNTAGQDGLILRTDKTMAKVGEKLSLSALSSVKGGTVYFDVIRNKQTIVTRAENAQVGQAQLVLPLTHDMVGTLQIRAYKILPNENIIRDTRTLIVSPADDLSIRVTADKTQYKPGGDAVLKFAVQDAQKRPAQAALGLAVVDESVFALSELQPGLERVIFTLEKELMEPKYELHGLTPSGLMQPNPVRFKRDEERQRAAALILASAPEPANFDIRVDTYAQKWAKVAVKTAQVMADTNRKIVMAAQKYKADTHSSLSSDEGIARLVSKGYLRESDLRDPWGRAYKVDMQGNKNFDNNYFTLSSAGPDGKWNTSDDIANVSLYGWNGNASWSLRSIGRRRGGREAVEDERLADRDLFTDEAAKEMLQKGRQLGVAGGGFGGGAFNGPAGVGARPMPMMLQRGAVMAAKSKRETVASPAESGSDAPRVRSFFPETMYWNPALITDEQGMAQLTVPLADSITTWRLSLLANSAKGQLGSTTTPLKVFQDFFVDIDLPVSLTQHDRVDVPVAIYNYLSTPQQVTLTLKQEPWFALQGKPAQTVQVGANSVSVAYYPLTANAIGRHSLEVTAKGSKLSDAMRREIAVMPDGRLLETTINDRLEGQRGKIRYVCSQTAWKGQAACS